MIDVLFRRLVQPPLKHTHNRKKSDLAGTYRLRKFSSEKGSASLETFLTLDLPRATMSEDGEPSDERGVEGGPCGAAFESNPPCSSVGSVGIVLGSRS